MVGGNLSDIARVRDIRRRDSKSAVSVPECPIDTGGRWSSWIPRASAIPMAIPATVSKTAYRPSTDAIPEYSQAFDAFPLPLSKTAHSRSVWAVVTSGVRNEFVTKSSAASAKEHARSLILRS